MKRMNSLILSLVAVFASCTSHKSDLPDGLYADITTNKGHIVIELEYEKAPVTVANFVSLAEGTNPLVDKKFKGKPFYDGLTFHRVVQDFVIQGGDPDGNGAGGPGYVFKDEFDPTLSHDKPGTLSMANSGPFTNGSQFFITHKETPFLDNKHSVFGYTVKGMDVVNNIKQNDKIESIKIIRIGRPAKKFNAEKVFKEYSENEAKAKKDKESKLAKIKKEYADKFASLKEKAIKTDSGLQYVITDSKEGAKKPNIGNEIKINYAGFFENGILFDTSVEDLAKAFNSHDAQRAAYNQYIPIPFKYGAKTGLIPGFIEGIEQMKIGDKAVIFIPSHLAYGERGAGGVIPPNTDLVFELELVE
ncbi:peptidylprolyl isomerase [Myroides pelagicus]|uniref:peptidylprolyl isomerase n=1 Tax=Myroides pelagicus TaxID=270914 RepID=A0A7K1GKN9_9FLAO|nr:peptidylprolyl isomerase [Myroides pelagicus]MEC4114260.1 peptidylprolyl isomerase [Myroides pelagicus]MTH29310.1 peptidylprolyl isomerase [Myroides pelagicus]